MVRRSDHGIHFLAGILGVLAGLVLLSGSASAALTVSQVLEQDAPTFDQCLQEALTLPSIESADMYKPGKVHGQRTDINLSFGAMTNCAGIVGRNGNFEIKMQDGRNPRHIITLSAWKDNLFPYTSNDAGVSGLSVSPIHGTPSMIYHCRKGPAVTQVWLIRGEEAIAPSDGHVIQTVKSKTAVTVHRNHGRGC
jgi:hypothetical protein